MVYRYRFSRPFRTDSVVCLPDDAKFFFDDVDVPFGKVSVDSGFEFKLELLDDDIVFGLGEAMGGINKRGRIYRSWCQDEPNQVEDKASLYGAHNFILVHSPSKNENFALYFDYPGLVTFDMGFTEHSLMSVRIERAALDLYVIKSESGALSDTVSIFRRMIGESYTPPFWAFGYMQSRWGYGSESDLTDVLENHRKHSIPLDAVFLDIDYMKDFRNFTVDGGKFSDFERTIRKLSEGDVHVVPIIDAGVKADVNEDSVCADGVKNGMFCRKKDGSLFSAGVWPGPCHFTDFLNPEARRWFGSFYRMFTDAGIDGFWNDMNEPALFYSEEGIKKLASNVKDAFSDEKNAGRNLWRVKDAVLAVQNSEDDYRSFYHSVDSETAGSLAESIASDGKALVRHDLVHNLYGFNMTRAASEFFSENVPDRKILLFSRASYIGAHRYGGIWTGDNCSWWSHLELCIRQLPSLNMCGFLYSGCDLGGFGSNVERDLMLRFLSLGVFTPLMRNHSALGTREQELYRFGGTEDFAAIVKFRYRMIPYIHSQFEKCVSESKMLFRPLSFDYQEDTAALEVEDQLMFGEDLMICPVYRPNATGRTVYVPEEMTLVRCGIGSGLDAGSPEKKTVGRGFHHIKCRTDQIVFFIKKGRKIPVCESAMNSAKIDTKKIELW